MIKTSSNLRLALVSAAAALALAGTAAAQAPGWPALERDYIAFTHVQDPVRAGARGDRAALERWPDDSPAALAAQKTALEAFKARLAAIPPSSLSDEDRLSRAVMARRVELSLEGLELDEARVPFLFGQGFFTMPGETAMATTLASEADAQAWLKRLAAIPAYFAVETANLQRGIDTGFTQPALVTRSAIKAVEADAAVPPEKSPLLLPFDTLPDTIPAARRAALRAEAAEIVRTRVNPAQAQLAAFLRDRYLPHSRPQLGVSSLPGGARFYAYLVRRETTTDLTPQQIHELGLKEVARIRAEMQALMDQAGFKGSPHDFAMKLKADPANYAPNALAYEADADLIAKRIDYLLPRYFGKLPRLTYGVRAKPPSLESTSGGYMPGSPETGQAGAVTFSAGHVSQAPLYDLPAWFAHEGVPGHHLQIALAQENTAIPEYRRNDDVTAFVEGWALYSERLGEDMGIYHTLPERFGRLSMEMWRACRLVMDTGVHAMGWSREQAMACLKQNTALSDASAEYETDRYIGWPGQALGYKIGELRIEALRRKAEQALGPAFSLRAFHDVVLGEGALPMDLLEARVDAWIAAQKAAR
jgi:uncharacterized protein (DUF885 family)